VNAFGFSFIACLYAGAELILNRGLYPLGYWQIVRAEGVTLLSCVPSVLQTLTQMLRRPLADPPATVRYATCGAAPLSQRLVRDFMAKTGFRVIQVYGMSEATNFDLTVETDLSDAEYEAIMFGHDRTSAGTPTFGMELDILRPDGRPAAEEESGEVVMRGWAVALGYHNFPDGTAEVFRPDWLHSGDVGRYRWFRGKKYFFLEGRLKEIAKRYSESISLIDIDQRLVEEPGFEQAVAVAFPNRAAGEEIGLYLVPGEATPDDEAAMRQLKRIFPEHRRPKVILRGAAVPKTSTGKIKRASLSPLFAAYEDTVFTS
jgi:long-chain acyl-CoA synthetase